ncbi:FHA domain-containing protein [Myxococcota bacterium]|nr:FHA domain-containing protein [Myxococcota bacterium]
MSGIGAWRAWAAWVVLTAMANAVEAAPLKVRSFGTQDYAESGGLSFTVSAQDENGPLEELQQGEWRLLLGDREVEAQAQVTPFSSVTPSRTAVLILIPATQAFVKPDDSAKAGSDRARTPFQYAWDGLAALKTQVRDEDTLMVGCYNESRVLPSEISGKAAAASSIRLPEDLSTVAEKCASGDASGEAPRLPTLLMDGIKGFMAKTPGRQRYVVVIVSDGQSSEEIQENWARSLQTQSSDRWVEVYVVGLEENLRGEDLQRLGAAGVYRAAVARRALTAQMKELGPWLSGRGVYQVQWQVQDRLSRKNAEMTLVARRGKDEYRSDPVPVGNLQRKTGWVRMVLLIAVAVVGLVILVLVVRLIVLAAAARRRRQQEEQARAAAESYDGPSRGRLIVREGPAQNRTFHLVEDVSYIGRAPDNHVCIPDSSVGKRHCSITISKDRSYLLEDMQSVNGVRVNGQKVLKVFLKDGDSIRLGSTEMQFRL